MTVLIVVLLFVLFIVADVLVRAVRARLELRRRQREREAALEAPMRLEWTAEAKSLKRVEVEQPKARILAVDDEPIVLDAFRKILVLDGFSVDTVESGAEALGLVQRRDYDFVFTDLKMPGMSGVDVVRGVKQLRPDVDVVVITGYATIESAVETMRQGAIEYVQKPFTVDELTRFARQLATKRKIRLEAQQLPVVRLVGRGSASAAADNEFTVPGGAFISDGHVWARIEPSGSVRVGLDDFAHKALGAIEHVELPAIATVVRRGQPLFGVHRGTSQVGFAAPFSGRVTEVNEQMQDGILRAGDPYEDRWVCLLEPSDLTAEIGALRIGKAAMEWYQSEILRLRHVGGPAEHGTPHVDWGTLDHEFFAVAAKAA